MTSQSGSSFDSSMKPFFILMKMIGLNLGASKKNDICYRFVHAFHFFIILLFILLTYFYGMTHTIEMKSIEWDKVSEEITEEDLKNRKNMLVGFFYKFYSDGLRLVLSAYPYLILFTFTLNGTWQKLRSNLFEIQNKCCLDESFHVQVRRKCLTGLTLVVVVILHFR